MNPEADQSYGVYILACADGTYYTGLTNNLERRLVAHNKGHAARYTRGRRPVKVVWWLDGFSRSVAGRLEVAVKRLPRQQKTRLVAGDKALLSRLQKRALSKDRR